MDKDMFRPPVVAILGHVDHGKTSLLDYIRKSRLTAKEHGGITQRIGAYEVVTGIKGYPTDKITFIDTPGHEAFSQLRARGANVADIAILIIDAKDSLKPQTIESISHIKSAKIPYLVALNKVDLPEANPDKVKLDLLKYQVVVEDKGGNVPCINISATKGTGIDTLLETILLLAAEANLTYSLEQDLEAYVIEARRDKRGIVASVIVKNGILRVGDSFYTLEVPVKVKALINDLGKSVKMVVPSAPCEVLGFADLPEVGVRLTSKPVALRAKVTQSKQKDGKISLDDFFAQDTDESKKLNLVIKSDSQGSIEAIEQSLAKIPDINVVMAVVGDINKSDVFLAKTTGAIVVGFSVNSNPDAVNLAKQEKVIIKTYHVIYELLEELEEVSILIKEKEQAAKHLKGEGKIIASFVIEGLTVYGAKINKGKATLGDNVQLWRNDKQIAETRLVSLQQRAKKVKEVKKDQECGLLFEPIIDAQVGDVIKFVM